MTNLLKTLAFGAALAVSAYQPAFANFPAPITTEPKCMTFSSGLLEAYSADGYRVEHSYEQGGAIFMLSTTEDGRYILMLIKGNVLCILMAGTLENVER